MGKTYKIVLTGGPCAGKTTALKILRDYFSDKYNILCVSESSTELMSGGVFPKSFDNTTEFMEYLTRLQCIKEDIFMNASSSISKRSKKDVIIFFDRGIFDVKAYMRDSDFDTMMCNLKISKKDALIRYDAVFHLCTAAINAPMSYGTFNNSIRTESMEESIELDYKTFQCWQLHPFLYRIDSCIDINDKFNVLINMIENFIQSRPIE